MATALTMMLDSVGKPPVIIGARIQIKDIPVRLDTPAMIGGFDAPNNMRISEWRAPSLLGALRVWWRAARLAEDVSAEKLYARECALFGASADDTDKGRGQGRVFLEIREISNQSTQLSLGTASVALLGGANVAAARQQLAEGSSATIRLTGRHDHLSDLEEVAQALDLLLSFGGVGFASRRGFGSLSRIHDATPSAADLRATLKALVTARPGTGVVLAVPSFSATVRLRTCVVAEPSGLQALEVLAADVGRYGSTALVPSIYQSPDRVFSCQTQSKDNTVQAGLPKPNVRHPSPLTFHVHRVKEGYLISALDLPVAVEGSARDRISQYFDPKIHTSTLPWVDDE